MQLSSNTKTPLTQRVIETGRTTPATTAQAPEQIPTQLPEQLTAQPPGKLPFHYFAALALLAALTTGCSSLLPLAPEDGRLVNGPGATKLYTNTKAGISFPIPADFVLTKVNDPDERSTIHLAGSEGVCQIDIMRAPFALDPQSHLAGIQAILIKDGNQASPAGAAKVGGAEAAHLHVLFPSKVVEELYTFKSGLSLTTIMIAKANGCSADFTPMLQGFKS